MIELVVFDLGGVILPFDHRQISFKLNKRSKRPMFFTAEYIFNRLFNLENGLINPYEEGQITTMDFFYRVREEFELDIDFEAFKEIWTKIFGEDEKVKEIIFSLKNRGYPLFLLSNTNELHFSYVMDSHPIVHLFDEWILSFEVGAKKPKREIFEKIFEKVDITPEKTLYIDDIKEYVDIASKMGMEAFLFSHADGLWHLFEREGLLR